VPHQVEGSAFDGHQHRVVRIDAEPLGDLVDRHPPLDMTAPIVGNSLRSASAGQWRFSQVAIRGTGETVSRIFAPGLIFRSLSSTFTKSLSVSVGVKGRYLGSRAQIA
jgi:hypothetical protein